MKKAKHYVWPFLKNETEFDSRNIVSIPVIFIDMNYKVAIAPAATVPVAQPLGIN